MKLLKFVGLLIFISHLMTNISANCLSKTVEGKSITKDYSFISGCQCGNRKSNKTNK